MKKLTKIINCPLAFCSAIFLTLVPLSSHAEVDLFSEIKQADKTMFDAFNACDIETMEDMFSRDLEFYHDLGGLGGSEKTINSTRNNCNDNLGLVRTLVAESLEVYPIKDFGAIQIGEHTFCHPAYDKEGKKSKDDCGTFDFTHIWKQTSNGWVVHRVVSYGH